MVGKNPFIGATFPKHESKTRAIWDADTICKALDACEDDRLFLAIHLSFACSLRLGEICGLTWDCVDISGAAILNENAYLKVEKVLTRVDEGAVQALGAEEIFFTFPAIVSGKAKTRLVLKKPKTESSIRKVCIPTTLAKLLRSWKESQEKLKLNKGDIKATQGDTGHSQPDMVTQVYAHILEEDQKVKAQRFEAGFYAKPNLREVEETLCSQTAQQPGLDAMQLLLQLQANPELAALLKSLLNANLFG